MKHLFYIIIILLVFSACSKSNEKEEKEIIINYLVGTFVEQAPEANRTVLTFTNANKLIQQTYNGNVIEYSESFTIDYTKTPMRLDCNECDVLESLTVSYEKLNEDSFKIGSLYPNESSEIMTFVKQ